MSEPYTSEQIATLLTTASMWDANTARHHPLAALGGIRQLAAALESVSAQVAVARREGAEQALRHQPHQTAKHHAHDIINGYCCVRGMHRSNFCEECDETWPCRAVRLSSTPEPDTSKEQA